MEKCGARTPGAPAIFEHCVVLYFIHNDDLFIIIYNFINALFITTVRLYFTSPD